MTLRLERAVERLKDAEAAMLASDQAMRTHGHQGITWALARYDARRLKRARQAAKLATEMTRAAAEAQARNWP